MNNLKQQYQKTVVKALREKFNYKNIMAVPTLEKVVLNVGLGAGLKDKEYIAAVKKTLEKISGQKPVETLAKKSISNFKIRQGNVVGVKVTLRGERMWDFIEKLIKVTLPRVRDFRGISNKAFDKNGNYTLGFKEYISFPEINQDEVDRFHGLEVCVKTTAETEKEGRSLLKELGFPLKKEDK